MVGGNDLYCVLKNRVGEDVTPSVEPNLWDTLRWTDEFGNSIAPFFLDVEAGRSFLREMSGWELKCYPVSLVVEVILADIKKETSFYTIDPESILRFEALSPAEFLTALICRTRAVSLESQDLAVAYQDVIPIAALVGEGRDRDTEVEYRRLLAAADLIFGIDAITGKQLIVYGRLSLEELLRTGQSKILGVVNVNVDQNGMELEKLATLVQHIKGYNAY